MSARKKQLRLAFSFFIALVISMVIVYRDVVALFNNELDNYNWLMPSFILLLAVVCHLISALINKPVSDKNESIDESPSR